MRTTRSKRDNRPNKGTMADQLRRVLWLADASRPADPEQRTDIGTVAVGGYPR